MIGAASENDALFFAGRRAAAGAGGVILKTIDRR